MLKCPRCQKEKLLYEVLIIVLGKIEEKTSSMLKAESWCYDRNWIHQAILRDMYRCPSTDCNYTKVIRNVPFDKRY